MPGVVGMGNPASEGQSSPFAEKYELLRRIGEGAEAEVWECAEREGRKRWAVKVRQRGMGTSTVEAEMEATRAAGGGGWHPGVVTVREAFSSAGAVQLVMELCRGGDLFDLIRARGPLPDLAAAFLFRQLAATLTFVHSRGIVHRDIKPENVLLDAPATCLYSLPRTEGSKYNLPRIQPKIGDFGQALFLAPGDTTSGVAGSPYYRAPEVYLDLPYGRRADVWSLGVVLCVMLTGRLPFSGRSHCDLEGLRRAVLSGRIDFSLPRWCHVAPLARDLVSKMLQPNPCKRLRMQDVLAHPWCASPEPPTPPSLAPSPSPQPSFCPGLSRNCARSQSLSCLNQPLNPDLGSSSPSHSPSIAPGPSAGPGLGLHPRPVSSFTTPTHQIIPLEASSAPSTPVLPLAHEGGEGGSAGRGQGGASLPSGALHAPEITPSFFLLCPSCDELVRTDSAERSEASKRRSGGSSRGRWSFLKRAGVHHRREQIVA